MNFKKLIMLAVSVACLATVGFAGEKHAKKEKCTASIQECLDGQIASLSHSAWDGIHVEGLSKGGEIKVSEIVSDSPGSRAGLKAGDILMAFDDKIMAGMTDKDLVHTMASVKVGSDVTYTVKRGHETMKVKVTMTAPPNKMIAEWVGKHMMWQHSDRELASF